MRVSHQSTSSRNDETSGVIRHRFGVTAPSQQARSDEPGHIEAAVARAEPVEARIFRKGTISPSPPQTKQTGTAGALAAWAVELAALWVENGMQFNSVARDRFRSSGYLTDGGRTPAAEYQVQLAAEGAADTSPTREGVAAIAVQQRALEAEVGSLSSSMAATQVQEGQSQYLLSAAGQYVPFAARIEAAGQAAVAEAADGAA
jgi:hypothetical protein